jgi:hypothetical protein
MRFVSKLSGPREPHQTALAMNEIYEFEIIVTETTEEVPPSNANPSSSVSLSTGLVWVAIIIGGLILYVQVALLAMYIGKEIL